MKPLIADAIPKPIFFAAEKAFPQLMFSIAPFTPSPINFPTLSQCSLPANASIPDIPILIACATVFPMDFPSPSTSIAPFIKVANDFPTLAATDCSFTQGMLSSAFFSFVPNNVPNSVKSALSHISRSLLLILSIIVSPSARFP